MAPSVDSSKPPQRRSEEDSHAHQIFRNHHPAHRHHAKPPKKDDKETVPGIRHPGATGVIYCTDRAMAHGFDPARPEDGWANFGQGAPEVGPIAGASERPNFIPLENFLDNEYAPTAGVKELREAVANLYNVSYRSDKESKYTAENVCIVPGGRAGMSRLASVVGDVYCGYQVPEYTAYSDIMSVFRRLVPIPTALREDDDYKMHLGKLKEDIKNQGLSVIVASNPRNPTGHVIGGKDLEDLVGVAKSKMATLLLDEFYSWYLYPESKAELGDCLSAARYVDEVNEDPVVVVDGLTKNWRLPGWRICWVVGPKDVISALSQSGSFLDGGASHVLQKAALPLLSPERVHQDRIALQKHFKSKRDHVLSRLRWMDLHVPVPPTSTFYIWVDLRGLPEPIDNGLAFFEAALKEKVIVVPGIFFDINPSHRRDLFDSPCHHFIRLSFGPDIDTLNRGLEGLERLLKRAREGDPELHSPPLQERKERSTGA